MSVRVDPTNRSVRRQPTNRALSDRGSETTVSDLSLKVGGRLTAAEPGGNDKPLAKPVAAAPFIRPVASVRPALSTEDFLPFAPVLASGELDSGLSTTGFEGVEQSPLVALSVPEPVLKIVPVERPILEVKPSAAPIAVYEPMEFLDYEDEDDSFSEPEPEFEPPTPLTAFLTVAIPQAASPAKPSAARICADRFHRYAWRCPRSRSRRFAAS